MKQQSNQRDAKKNKIKIKFCINQWIKSLLPCHNLQQGIQDLFLQFE